MLIKFLLYKMRSVDGAPKTADIWLNHLCKVKEKQIIEESQAGGNIFQLNKYDVSMSVNMGTPANSRQASKRNVMIQNAIATKLQNSVQLTMN